MPTGIDKIEQLSKEANERSRAFEAGEGAGIRALKLDVGESAIGRFCEEGSGVWFLYMHDLPKKPNQRYADRVQCLDQDDLGLPCPAHDVEGAKRTARVVINFIRYDEPKLRRGTDGKAVKDAQGNYVFDGVEPTLVVWETSQANGGRIAYLERENNGGDPSRGITNHVVKIFRSSQKEYNIDVVERNKAPEPFEHALFAKKVSPDKAIQNVFPRYLSRPVLSLADMRRIYSGAAATSGFAQGSGDQNNVYAQAAQQSAGGGINTGPLG